jgi:hypothetical protein
MSRVVVARARCCISGAKVTDHISFGLSFESSEYLAVLAPTDVGGLFFERPSASRRSAASARTSIAG